MKIKIALSLLVVLLLSNYMFSENPQHMPDFSVVSGDNKTFTFSDVGNKILLIFYATKETETVNINLENRLTELYNKNQKVLSESVMSLGVADCSSAFLPVKSLWKDGLIKKSKEKGVTIYGDWSGKMRNDFHFILNEANFMIIDKNKMIRYQASGKISNVEIEKICTLIETILNEQTRLN